MKSASAISHSNSKTEVLVSKRIILKVGKAILMVVLFVVFAVLTSAGGMLSSREQRGLIYIF